MYKHKKNPTLLQINIKTVDIINKIFSHSLTYTIIPKYTYTYLYVFIKIYKSKIQILKI